MYASWVYALGDGGSAADGPAEANLGPTRVGRPRAASSRARWRPTASAGLYPVRIAAASSWVDRPPHVCCAQPSQALFNLLQVPIEHPCSALNASAGFLGSPADLALSNGDSDEDLVPDRG